MTNPQEAAAAQTETRQKSPAALVKAYSADLTLMLPSHVRADTWVRLAQGALKRGDKADDGSGRYVLEVAAANNPEAFMQAVKVCAMLGLQPGSDEFHLTPRKEKGKLQILGIVGYQGYIELMHRAGAVESVVAEVVYEGDGFEYQPGRDSVPNHVIDWDDDEREGRPLRLVYAYANMRGGAVSKVVVLSKSKIDKIKAKSPSAKSDYSPWNTDPASMWLKSGVRQLRKWVPTSAEYRAELRGDAASAIEARERAQPQRVDTATGEILDGDDDGIVDAEVVE